MICSTLAATLSAQLEARCVVRDGLDLRLRGEALR